MYLFPVASAVCTLLNALTWVDGYSFTLPPANSRSANSLRGSLLRGHIRGNDLRRNVLRCSAESGHHFGGRDNTGQSKISEFDLQAWPVRQQDVFRLEISMSNIAGMKIGQSLQDLPNDIARVLLRVRHQSTSLCSS